ncbi:putative ribonuclease H-like domain-containing protein [Tanacetum coccineum]
MLLEKNLKLSVIASFFGRRLLELAVLTVLILLAHQLKLLVHPGLCLIGPSSGPSFVPSGGSFSIDVANLPHDPLMLKLEDTAEIRSTSIFGNAYDDHDLETLNTPYADQSVGAEVDFNNMEPSTVVSPIPTTRVHSTYPKAQIIGDLKSAVQTRGMTKKNSREHAMISCIQKQRRTNHKDFQNCLLAFDLPSGKKAIGTKWVYRNKKDERGIVVRNKARLVAQEYKQEEGIDYDKVFAPVARVEAIRLFLVFASFMNFPVYQMDVKSAFLYGTIEEETLFIKRLKGDILLVQVYVDDIIFGSTKKSLCDEFKQIMHNRFQMSSMGELTFLLGLQVKQKENGIFISQDKYVGEILKKFGFSSIRTANTPMETNKALTKDEDGEDIDFHLYRSMIGSLMYLTSSRPDIMYSVCACSRFQVQPKVSYVNAAKRIFRYLKGQPKLGLWYPRGSPSYIEAFSDMNYSASLDRKSTTGEELVDRNEKLPLQLLALKAEQNVVPRNHIGDVDAHTSLKVKHHPPLPTNNHLHQLWSSQSTHIPVPTTPPSIQITHEVEETATMPYDSPLPGGHTPRSDEGRMQHTELMKLLVLKVKKLEKQVRSGKARRRARIEDVETREKNSVDTEVLLEETTPTELIKDLGNSEKDEELARKVQEEEQAKEMAEQEQERINFEAALELQRQLNEREEVPTEATRSLTVDWSDPDVLNDKEKGTEKKSRGSRKKTLARKRAGEKKSKESSKRQKNEDAADYEQEKAELRLWLKVAQDDEEFVNLKFVYQLIKVQVYHGKYKDFLRKTDREDLSTLYRLVQERFQDHPLEGRDLLLWGDLRMIFDPDEKDDIWMNQLDWKLLKWILHENCGVHTFFMDGTPMKINMLVEKKYLLINDLLEKMLNLHLEAEEESTMAFELLKFIKSQIEEQ